MQANLKIKDLVTIGVFAVVYLVIMITSHLMQIIPILLLVFPAFNALIQGVVVMLFMAKVPKKWALFTFGMVMTLLILAFGNTYVVLVNALIFMTIAEVLFRHGNFVSFKYNALAYAFMSCWWMGSYSQILILREQYTAHVEEMVGAEYAQRMQEILSYPNVIMIYVATFAFGLLGAYIGKKVLTKHFEKAGIV